MSTLPVDEMIREREHLAAVRERICVEYRERAMALNQLIDRFNLKAPRAELHRERIRVEEAIQKFRDAWGR